MDKMVIKKLARQRRQRRIRATIKGTASRPRLAVFRSLKHITAQLIDDQRGVTLVTASDLTAKAKGTKMDKAKSVGQAIAAAGLAKKITTVVFDRGGNKYHGRIKALADAAREVGLTF